MLRTFLFIRLVNIFFDDAFMYIGDISDLSFIYIGDISGLSFIYIYAIIFLSITCINQRILL